MIARIRFRRDYFGIIREDSRALPGECFDPEDSRDVFIQRRKKHRGSLAPHTVHDKFGLRTSPLDKGLHALSAA